MALLKSPPLGSGREIPTRIATPVTWPMISASFGNANDRVLIGGKRMGDEEELAIDYFAPRARVFGPKVNKVDWTIQIRSGSGGDRGLLSSGSIL